MYTAIKNGDTDSINAAIKAANEAQEEATKKRTEADEIAKRAHEVRDEANGYRTPEEIQEEDIKKKSEDELKQQLSDAIEAFFKDPMGAIKGAWDAITRAMGLFPSHL